MTKKVNFKVSFNIIADFNQNEYQRILDELNITHEEYLKNMKTTLERELKKWIFRKEKVSNVKIRTIKS